MRKNINLLAVFVLIIYPILLLAYVAHYAVQYGLGWFEISLLILGYYGANISVGVGLHRLWSHDTFKTNTFVEFILVMISAGTLQGPVLSWASNHYKHHTYTDTPQDPHTPLTFDNKIKGFLWSHIGWMLVGEGSYKSIDRLTMKKLGKKKLLRWQLKYYWKIALFMNIVLPLCIGYTIGGTLLSAYSAFIFIGLGRAIQQHATFCVNSACHFFGSKKYYQGTAGDIWWLALFLFGENWHNFHHAFPSDYRNGVKWYHLDVHKWIIYIMSKMHLAWDLKRTPKIRIQAKITKTQDYFSARNAQQLIGMQDKVLKLIERLNIQIQEIENSSEAIAKQFKRTLAEMYSSLNSIKQQINISIKLKEKSANKFVKNITKEIDKIEQSAHLMFEKFKSV